MSYLYASIKFLDSLFVFKICRKYRRYDGSIDSKHSKFLENASLLTYLLITGQQNNLKDYYAREQKNILDCKNSLLNLSENEMRYYLDFIDEHLDLITINSFYKTFIFIFFEELSGNIEVYNKLLIILLQKENLSNLFDINISKLSIEMIGKAKLLDIIEKHSFIQTKQRSILTFYESLTLKSLNDEDIQEFLLFLDTCDNEVLKYINLTTISETYFIKDNQIINKIYKVILKKTDDDRFISNIFKYIFYNEQDKIIKKFDDNLDLIYELYLKLNNYDNSIDYNNNLFVTLVEDKPSRILDYIDKCRYNPYQNKLIEIWKIKDYENLIDSILKHLYKKNRVMKLSIFDSNISSIVNYDKYIDKSTSFFRDYIKDNKDNIDYIYFLIDNLFKEIPIKERKNYITIFLDVYPDDMNIFEALLAQPMVQSYDGSRSSFLADRKREYESIKELMSTDNIYQINFLKEEIKKLDEEIQKTEIYELLNPIFK